MAKKNKKAKVTPELLERLQAALNDSVKPTFKERKGGKKKSKPKKVEPPK